jgi:hypothetical protein
LIHFNHLLSKESVSPAQWKIKEIRGGVMEVKVNTAAFVRAVGMVLQAADVGIDKAVLYDDETVEITYSSGRSQFVDIARDSRLEILKDIIQAVSER